MRGEKNVINLYTQNRRQITRTKIIQNALITHVVCSIGLLKHENLMQTDHQVTLRDTEGGFSCLFQPGHAYQQKINKGQESGHRLHAFKYANCKNNLA